MNCVHMCMSVPKGINNYSHKIKKLSLNNWLNKFYWFSGFFIHNIRMSLDINIIDGCGLSNEACCERFSKRLSVM